MDISDQKVNSNRADDTSLGILNMNNLKVFGDLSHESLETKNSKLLTGTDRAISDRLHMERLKSLAVLRKSDKSDLYKLHPGSSNKENMRSLLNNASTSSSKTLDRTDYVPFRRPNSINISDLVTDETINLETTSSCPPSAIKGTKISFEPSEMTGRSTLHNKDLKSHRNIASTGTSKTMSVGDILSSSFAPKARNLRDSLNNVDSNFNLSNESHQVARTSSVSSSTTWSSFNASKSLPRTADMSLSKASLSQLSFAGAADESFSFNGVAGAGAGHDINISNENFAPGELMQSKLIMDEISWAEKYAAIPTKTLSEEAKAVVAKSTKAITTEFEPISASNATLAGDPNFSLGKFFQQRSDNIWDMVKTTSPDNCRSPFCLVDEDDTIAGTVSSSSSSMQMKSAASRLGNTPEIDNKTYTRASNQIRASSPHNTSFLLSMTAIDKALHSLERDSCSSVTDHFLKRSKIPNPNANQLNYNTHRDTVQLPSKGTSYIQDRPLGRNKSNLQAVSEIILENKENLDPQIMRRSGNKSDFSDTLSFTESVLNSSEMKQMQNGYSAAQRSPLSPIEVRAAPAVMVTAVSEGEEADNDEYPTTPIVDPNRRIRRTKSPRDRTPLRGHEETEDSDAVTPMNSRISSGKRSIEAHTNTKKSMCSTRLDGEGNDCDFGISPNLSANKSSALNGRSNNTLTNSSSGLANMDNSPLSTSARSYLQTQACSPTPTSLDTTSNSDRQTLSAGVVKSPHHTKVIVSSPVGSETSSTCSYASMHSARSAATTGTIRSISRCSSTSEFSHRDGKAIPLKVTATELSWGSVKLRSDSRKSMQIKNVTSKRLVIRVEVCGPGFQIINNERSNNMTLHSLECRTINIIFCPTVPGVALGKLLFFAPNGAHTVSQSFMDLPLYGYGGSASIMPQKISLGPTGCPFVVMGDICELSQPLQRTVRFYNKGPLLGFAVFTVDSLGLALPYICDAFEIQPQRVLIPPRNFVDVQILFKPIREDIRKILKKIDYVLSLATLRVISGDEANRQRIRRLLLQMNETERARMSVLDRLWSKYPGEEEITELAAIRENHAVAMDLTTGFRVHEIVLTINRENLDETAEASSLFLADADETVLFRTVVCAADSNSPTPPTSLGTVYEVYDKESEEDDHQAFSSTADKKMSSWSVRPSFIEINLKHPEHASLFVCNGFKSQQYFEVACNKPNLLRFSPAEGYVAPDNGQTEIFIDLNLNAPRIIMEDVFIMVNMENERIMVPVKIQ